MVLGKIKRLFQVSTMSRFWRTVKLKRPEVSLGRYFHPLSRTLRRLLCGATLLPFDESQEHKTKPKSIWFAGKVLGCFN